MPMTRRPSHDKWCQDARCLRTRCPAGHASRVPQVTWTRSHPQSEHPSPCVRVYVLGSGSSGNCLVVEAEGERLVLEAGMGPVRATMRMRTLGAELTTPRAPLGLFVTHHHGDHAAHAVPIARALRAPLHLHPGLETPRPRARLEVRSYVPGRAVPLASRSSWKRCPCRTTRRRSRCASPPRDGASPSRRTWGTPRARLRAFLAGCDLVLLDIELLPRSARRWAVPPRLKLRVAGPLGHPANAQAAEIARVAARLARRAPRARAPVAHEQPRRRAPSRPWPAARIASRSRPCCTASRVASTSDGRVVVGGGGAADAGKLGSRRRGWPARGKSRPDVCPGPVERKRAPQAC